jgi:Protein of unknown function, DUF481
MMRTIFACLLVCVASAARADVILMRNGDRISGETVAMAGGKLVVRTAYAGELIVEWSEVASLETDRPLAVMFHGADAPELLRLGREVVLARIAYLNPKPHESGTGTTYTGRAALSANYTSGNATSRRLYGDAELTARAARHRYQLGGKIERRAEDGADATSAWRTAGNLDRFLDARRFAYVRGALEHDSAKDLELRSSAGFGLGAELVQAANVQVSLRGGLDYVQERRDAGEERDYPALGWGLRATYAPWPALELFHEHDGLRNLRANGVVVHSKTGLRIPFTPALSATAQVNVDWESRPAPGRGHRLHSARGIELRLVRLCAGLVTKTRSPSRMTSTGKFQKPAGQRAERASAPALRTSLMFY